MSTNREEPFRLEDAEAQFEAILERVLRAYHRNEGHGSADWIGETLLDAELVPVAREAFLDADDMPPDRAVLQVLDGEGMHLLGEGDHVMTLAESGNRFVVKYAKNREGIPRLAPSREQPGREDWTRDHGIQPEGRLHPVIWQHIRSLDAYGPLVVPSRVYIAESAYKCLTDDQRRALERFRSIGIVRSLGSYPRTLRVHYPHDFPIEKRSPDGVVVSVLVVQPLVTPVASAIERGIRAGNLAAVWDLEARYRQFMYDLWRYGYSHLDFSILNVGITGSEDAEFKIIDPHMSVVEVMGSGREVQEPLAGHPPGWRSVEDLLHATRDGTQRALSRSHEDGLAPPYVSQERAAGAAEVLREFHVASGGIEQGHEPFGLDRFDRMWWQRGVRGINTVLHAELCTLLQHPLCRFLQSILAARAHDAVNNRALLVLGMDDERPLAQFRAGLRVYRDRPLLLIMNVADDAPGLVKQWGRLRLPPEVDVLDDPTIHYHLRDLLTGETYVRSGEELTCRGFVLALAPYELHALQVEDVVVDDLRQFRDPAFKVVTRR
ncbi:MAG: hypothetical protein ACRD3C_15690 [Vicinamibacterales bacterium]